MRKPILSLSALLVLGCILFGHNTQAQNSNKDLARPKLVVGIVIDQMRWDFLYRYYSKYGGGGFKRMLDQGFSAENTRIPYALSVTAAGHASIYTGSVPALNGIVGNEWFDRSQDRYVYCVEDNDATLVGAEGEAMSPRNLTGTTLTDELLLATNFESKVVGISLKDRGSILPAGHMGTAYWYSDNGNWITSDYYMKKLPGWVQDFNGKRYPDSFYAKNWNLKNPANTYTESDKDNVPYEGKFSFESSPSFPHKTDLLIGKSYSLIRATPYGNSLTFDFAKAAIKSEDLGKDAVTDFLAVSCSSTDYIGHQFGPNSVEIQDTYLRLDADLETFFNYLDAQVGKGEWTVFLSSDHGVAQVPGYLKSKKIDVTALPNAPDLLGAEVDKAFKVKNLISGITNFQVYLNHRIIDSAGLDVNKIKQFIINRMNADPTVLITIDNEHISDANLPTEIKEKLLKGYYQKLSGEILIILKSGYFYGSATGTTHGTIFAYDDHIPFLMMGWGVKPGKLYRETSMTDIAATVAAMLNIQMPSGCIGKVVAEALAH